MSVPGVVYAAPAIACALSWLGIGSLLPRRWLPAGRLAGAMAATAFGIAALGLAGLALGRLGLFERWLLVAATLPLAAVGGAHAWSLLRSVRLPTGRASRILLALVAAALALNLVAAAGPPTSPDALKYHAALPDRWLETGRMEDPFFLWEGFNPATVEVLFAQGLAFARGGEAASVVGALLAVLAAAAVFGLARELGGGDLTAAAAGAALFVLQGLVTWEATSMFVELALVFYGALASWLTVRWVRARDTRDLAWASFCCGGAAACKYLGLAVAAPLGAALAAGWAARVRTVTAAAALLLPVIAVAGPWYAKNAIATGNPVYPVAFGGEEWGADDQRELDLVYERYGVGESPLRLVALPYDLIADGDAFDRGRYVGFAIFVFAALALRLAPGRTTYTLWVGVAAYLTLWWATSSQARFLLPALAVLAALGGVAAAGLLRRGGMQAAGASALLVVAVAAWAAPTAALTRQLLPAAVGTESPEAAAERLTGTADALRAAASRVTGTLGVVEYQFTFHYPELAIPLGSARFGPGTSRADALDGLGDYGVTHVLAPSRPTLPLFDTLRPCLRPVIELPARLVTSRTLGESVAYPLTLYQVAPCRSR